MKYTALALIPAAYSLPASQSNVDGSGTKGKKAESVSISQQNNGGTSVDNRFWYGYPVKGYNYYFNDPYNIYPYYGYVYGWIPDSVEPSSYLNKN
jgi:hypothetical protein